VAEPNITLTSGNRVALDAEEVKLIQGFEADSLKNGSWNHTQIWRAVEYGLGPRSEEGCRVASRSELPFGKV